MKTASGRRSRCLSAKKPRGYVEILSRLHRLVKLDLERRAAQVESATPLAADLQADVTGRIEKIYGAGVSIAFTPESGADRRLADPGRQRPLRWQCEDAFGKVGAEFLIEIYE